MKTKNKSGIFSLSIFTLISVIGVLCVYSARHFFVFVDSVLMPNIAFALYLFSILTTTFLFTTLCLKLRGEDITKKKIVKIFQVISEIIGVILFVFPFVILIGDTGESFQTIFYLFSSAFPTWAAIVCVAFFAFVFPAIKSIKVKKCISVIAIIALVISAYVSLFPVSVYKFTSGPIVIDDGKDNYAIVFATNDKGTGYVKYIKDKNEKIVFDESNGRKNGQSTIHTVKVPKEDLSNNKYIIGSTRIIDELSYGGRAGKTIESEEYSFNDSFDKNINLLSVSDWHTKNATALKAVKALNEEYQAVVLLGDCAPGLMSEKDVSKYIVDFGFELTKGSMPIIYTRGNHETRGKEAVNLSKYLGLDQFYFQTKLGDYDIIVLDSCEDKNDSHTEYGGMVNYMEYRKDMVNWLENIDDDFDKMITFCHSKDIAIEEDLSKKALDKLFELNTSLIVSGHLHKIHWSIREKIPFFVDGGINSNYTGGYCASMIKLSPDNIGILCVSEGGTEFMNKTMNWK